MAPELCAYLSSYDGCECLDGQVIKLTSGGAGSGSWSGTDSTTCGTVGISINCRACCPSLGKPGTMTAVFAAETLSVGPCLCIDGFSIALNWDETRQGMYGQGLSPCGDTVAVFLDFSQASCIFSVSSDRYSITNLGTTTVSCSPFQLTQHCQQVSATTTAFKVTITGGGDAGTGADASCMGYYLTLTCGDETKTVFPDSCTCGESGGTGAGSHFSLTFPPVTLTGCCSGTVTVVVTDECILACCPGELFPLDLNVTAVKESFGFPACDCIDGETGSITWDPSTQLWTGTMTACGCTITITMDLACNVSASASDRSISRETSSILFCNPIQSIQFFDMPCPTDTDPISQFKLIVTE